MLFHDLRRPRCQTPPPRPRLILPLQLPLPDPRSARPRLIFAPSRQAFSLHDPFRADIRSGLCFCLE